MSFMIDRALRVLERHLPGLQPITIAPLGEGWDNVALEVNGDLMIVRLRKENDPMLRQAATQSDIDKLEAARACSTMRVPEVIFPEPAEGVLAYTEIGGHSLLSHPAAALDQIAPAIGGFLSRLHAAPLNMIEMLIPHELEPLLQWRDEAAEEYRQIVHLVPPRVAYASKIFSVLIRLLSRREWCSVTTIWLPSIS